MTQVIYPENISSLAASTENPNYPDSNLQDKHPKKVWRGVGQTATIKIVSTLSEGLAIFKTNSETLNVSVGTGQNISWDTGNSWISGISWDKSSTTTLSTYNLTSGNEGSGWADWDEITGNHTITVSLDAGSGNIIEAGIITAGTVPKYDDPMNGIGERLVDYSIVKELNNGAFYTRKRDIVRQFSFNLSFIDEADFYELLLDILKSRGPDPLAFRISDKQTNWEWVVYGRVLAPNGQHRYADNILNIELLEVL